MAAIKNSIRTKSKQTGENGLKTRIMEWIGNHPDETRVFGIGAAIAFFYTHGLPLWDDDYGQWLAQAEAGFFALIARVLLPITSEPLTWGYSDRPLQVLLYKLYSLVFGTWGTGYFFMKSLVFGGLVATIFHILRVVLKVDRLIAGLAALVFALSANSVASLVYHSDFGVYSQLILALALVHGLKQIGSGPSSTSIFSKGFSGIPADFKRFSLVFFALVYFGTKIKGDVRLAPVILLAYLAITDREKLKVYAAPFGATLALTLPWSTQIFKHLPPFLGGAGYQGWTYAPFSVKRTLEFLFSDAFMIRGTPLSVVGGFGLLVVLALAAYGVYKAYREELDAPSKQTTFYLVWFGVVVIAMGMIGPQNSTFQLRYTLVALVPATILAGMFLNRIYAEFKKTEWIKPAIGAVIALQCILHTYHAFGHRRDMGRTQVAVDGVYRTVQAQFPESAMVHLPGFIPYGYRTKDVGAAIKGRKALGSVEEIKGYVAGQTVAASWTSTLDARFSVGGFASSCARSLFDLIVRCGPNDGAWVLKYIGAAPEIAQAQAQADQGNLTAARDTLEAYLKKDPGNHGAAFVLSLYAYRLKDYARMEQIYDQIAPHFQNVPAVVYNWALSKQGLQKYKEAAKYFEVAYTMAPKDYAIGFNLADAYYRQGKKSRALATLGELMQVYPNDSTMKQVHSEWSK